MEHLVNKRNYEEPLYEIVGKESQSLQFVLMPNQKLLTKTLNIIYASENIEIEDKTEFSQKMKQLWTGGSSLNTIVHNPSDSIGYVNINMCRGRIIMVNPLIMNDLIVKEEYILGFTDNIELLKHTCKDYFKATLGAKQLFRKVRIKSTFHQQFSSILSQNKGMGHANMLDLVPQVPPQEFAFLQGDSNFIEKMLGEEEKIQVRPECLAAFSECVQIISEERAHLNSKSPFLIKIQGPGIIYIDTKNDKETRKAKGLKADSLILMLFLYLTIIIAEVLIFRALFEHRIFQNQQPQ